MPTLSGMRRRGYTPEAIRAFADTIGVSKANSLVDVELLEHVLRDDLNTRARRVMAVVDPVKVIIDNYPEDQVEEFEVAYFPWDKENSPTRLVAPLAAISILSARTSWKIRPRSSIAWRRTPKVRLMNAYYITCVGVVKNDAGEIVELHCTYDPESRGGMSPDGRKVKGTLHWVSARHALDAELRLYDYLFTKADPYDVPEGGEFTDNINPDSLQVVTAKLEPGLMDAEVHEPFQFMRQGYFCADEDSTPEKLVFNRTISLVDTWAKMEKEKGK